MLFPSSGSLPNTWDDRKWASRIELERRLSEAEAAVVLLDGRRYQGRPRSLRIAIAPVVLGGGAMLHAKVTLVVRERCVLLAVASANLTEPGYRRNREVAATWIARLQRPEHALLMRDAIEQMPAVFGEAWTSDARRAAELALERLTRWGSADRGDRGVSFLWSHRQSPLWRQFLARWPTDDRVRSITVVSPFWSEENGEQAPIATFVQALRERGALVEGATLRLGTSPHLSAADAIPSLPASFATFDARAHGVRGEARAVRPDDLADDRSTVQRQLHAKVVLLEGERHSLAYIGSANFTRHGWGFAPFEGASANIEAGIAILRTGEAAAALGALVPPLHETAVPLDGAATGKLHMCVETSGDLPWPAFLRAVSLVPDEADRAKARRRTARARASCRFRRAWSTPCA